jgi:DNA-binding XRE family transcriptional regulator
MPSFRISFAQLCRDTRLMLDITQQQLATTVLVSRAHIAAIETGRANPSMRLVDRIADALGLELELIGRPPTVIGGVHQRDFLHARCSGYVDRRLGHAGWETRRELEVVHARSHGWIDLLAYHPVSRTLVIVEIKTTLDDFGAVERQLGWYERSSTDLAHRIGWRPTQAISWLLLLATDEVEASLRENRELLRVAFPNRAGSMIDVAVGEKPTSDGRAVALLDPHSRRQRWLIPTRLDGRRSAAPYRDYADAARRLSG